MDYASAKLQLVQGRDEVQDHLNIFTSIAQPQELVWKLVWNYNRN